MIEKSAAQDMQQPARAPRPQPHPGHAGYGERGEYGERGGHYGKPYRRKSWLGEIFD